MENLYCFSKCHLIYYNKSQHEGKIQNSILLNVLFKIWEVVHSRYDTYYYLGVQYIAYTKTQMYSKNSDNNFNAKQNITYVQHEFIKYKYCISNYIQENM